MKILKYILIVPLIVCCNTAYTPQKTGSGNDLEAAIMKTIKAFNDRDANTLNKMLHKEYGLTVVFRQGIFDQHQKTNTIDFENPVPDYLSYPRGIADTQLRYEALPTYDCDTGKWSKTGLFCDPEHKDHLLSKTAMNQKKYVDESLDQKIIDDFKAMEENSHRVVLIDREGADMIFYLTKDGNAWYLTALDRVSSDCDL